MSHIIPAHKKNDKRSLNNYCPVSLLPICGKIFERTIFNVFLFLEDNNLTTPNQSGTMTFYIKHHENLLHFIFDSFLTRNVLKITSSIPMEGFSLNFKAFYYYNLFSLFSLK